MSPLDDIPESDRSTTDERDRTPEPAESGGPAPWPEETLRRCEDCGHSDATTRRRINRPSKPSLCNDCFTNEE